MSIRATGPRLVFGRMPEVSRFHGMVIQMFINDHGPPHFHVRSSVYSARIGLSPLAIIDGDLRGRQLALALEWANLHREELARNWQRLRLRQPARRIPPLE